MLNFSLVTKKLEYTLIVSNFHTTSDFTNLKCIQGKFLCNRFCKNRNALTYN
jgi:hypothetical protein